MGYRGKLTPNQVVGEEAELTPAFLDRWAAEKVMGWTRANTGHPDYWYVDENNEEVMPIADWRPSDPITGQIWIVIDKLRSQDFNIEINCSINYHIVIYAPITMFKADDKNPCLAILKAAYAAVED